MTIEGKVTAAEVHRKAIVDLASELRVEPADVERVYESELAAFADARVRGFVPILVGRRVRRRVRAHKH